MPAELEPPVIPAPDAANPPAPAPDPAAEEAKSLEAIGDFFGLAKGEPVAKPKKEGEVEPAAKPAAKPARKPAKVAQRPAAEPMTAATIAAAAAEGVARAMKPAPGAPAAAEPKPADDLPPKERRKVEVLARMEQLYPEDYKDISKRYVESLKKLSKYADDWEAEHPGETFDDAADEHTKFFEQNNVDWEDHDFNSAIARIASEKTVEEKSAESNNRLSEVERVEKLRTEQPKIISSQITAQQTFTATLGEDYADLIDVNGVWNQEKLAKLAKEEPTTYKHIVAATNQLHHEIGETYKLMNHLAPFDAQNPAHTTMLSYVNDKEAAFSKLPPSERRTEDGRDFATRHKYFSLPPDERAGFWCLDFDSVKAMRAADLARERQQIITSEETAHRAWAEARGFKVPDKTKKDASATDAKPAQNNGGAVSKPVSPSAGGESRLAAAALATPGGGSGDTNTFFD